MKRLILLLSIALLTMVSASTLHATVTYKLSYNSVTQVYTVSFNSTVAYSGALARITPSTQITIVVPDPDGVGAGTFTATNLTALTALNWGVTQLNSPAQNPTKDYLFFAPANSGAYAPFSIPANTDIPIFSFKSASPCMGTLYLYDNITDPLNANMSVNADNNIKIFGGGNVNLYVGNSSGPVSCPPCLLSNITAITTNVSCFGGANGAGTIVAADGTPPYTYAWPASAGNQTAQTVTNLAAGTYVVSVADSGGCIGTVTATITEPTVLTASASTVSNILCFGTATGSVTVAASGGTPPYMLLWPGGSTNQTVNGLPAGTYTVTVTDANDCTKTSSATVTQPLQTLSGSITATTNVGCFGGSNGSATAAGSGGTSPYAYLWSNGQTTATATGLNAAIYTVTITDANNCTATTTATITAPAVLTAAITAQTNVLCNGVATGSASISVSGGTVAYSYLWPVAAGSQTMATATNLSPGIYTATVTDGQGCMATTTATITGPAAPLTVNVTGTNVSCGGSNNGSATATPAGGIPGYTYLWSTGVQTATANNLVVGTHTVTITDQNGCTVVSNVVIGQNTGTVSYKLTLDPDGETYRVSFNSSVAYNGPLARITGSTQFTLVFPDPDGAGAGAVQLANVTSLTNLNMNYIQLNSPGVSPAKDYAFFAPTNAGAYTLFNIPANTDIALFTFKIPGGCAGAVSLFDNYADPLNANPSVSADNSFKTLGGGNISLYCNNTSGPVACPLCMLSNVTAVTTDVSCFGGANGTATIIAADGVPQYTYTWPVSAGSQTTQTVTNLMAGTYTVTVTDGVGCTGTVTFTITQPPALTAVASIVAPVLCNGATNGSIMVLAGGGTPGYSILWSGGSTDQTVMGLSAGVYTVTVTDSKSCSVTATVSLTQPAQALSATITAFTNASCAGSASGTATVTPGGGTGPYNYLWSNGQTTAMAIGLAAGNYTVTVTDANTCTATSSVTINQPSALTAVISAQTDVLCNAAATGSATIVAVGGSPNYSYLWPVSAGSQSSATGIGLPAGTYVVTVTDAQSCTAAVTVLITQPILGLTVATAGVNVSCGGTNNGSATATPTGGTPGYTYLWSTGALTATAHNLGVGTYMITVTDQNGCTAVTSVVIGQNTGSVVYKLKLDPDGQTYRVSFNSSIAYSGPLARITGSTQFTLVFPDPDGAGPSAVQLANVTSLTALEMDYIQLDNPAENPAADYVFFAPTNAGAYTLFNIPANTDIDLFTFKIPAGCTGSIALFDNYADLLNANPNISADNNFKVLGGGNTNLYCNNATAPVPCSTCLLSNITIISTQVSCFGGANGSATAIAADGTPQYSYLWSNMATTQTVTGLAAGTYTVTITDGLGCTGTATVVITQPSDLTATAVQVNAVSCFGGSNGSASVTPAGGTPGYTYQWSSGSTDQTATGLTAGTYTVTVTDAANCTQTATATITQPASAVAVTITTSTNVSCFGGSNGSATASGTGGTGTITYLWNNGQTLATATGLIAGTYNVTATDANGCTATISVVITEPAQLTASITAQTNVLCNGASTGSATVTAAGVTTAYTYLWSNTQTSATATNLAAGTYTVTVTDAKGCTTATSVTITQPTVLVADITSQVNIGCNGASTGSATVNATGGATPYTYSWNTVPVQTTATASGLTAGTYMVTVTDANNCTKSASVTITQSPALTATAAQVNAVSCFGGSNGSASVTPVGGTPGYTYQWSSGSTDQTATGLTAGIYTVTVTDAANCTQTASVTISQPASAVAVTITTSTNVSCFGGSNGSATASGTGGTGAITYLWNNGQTSATAINLAAGTYNITATDANGCTATISVVITEPAQLTASITAQTNVLCNGSSTGSATVTVMGGTTTYNYDWTGTPTGDGTATVTGLSAGTYFVTVTDAKGCTTATSITITQPTVLVADITSQVNIGCNGASTGSATVNATGGATPYTYSWNTVPAQTTATATGLVAGSYSVTVTDANNCTKSASVTITQSPALTATAAQVNAVSCFGGSNGSASVTPAGGTPGYTYQWSSGSTDQTATGLAAGTYTVTVTDAANCTQTVTATIAQPASAVIVTISTSTNVSCFGGSNGSATASGSGGTGTITYLWNNGQTSATATGLIAGTYNVTAMDANGCTATISVVITEPAQLTASIMAQTNVLCNGASTGSATVTAAGGTTAYTYLWSNTQTTAMAINLAAGTYTMTVTDAKGCTTATSVTITQPTVLVADITSQVNIGCNGASTGSATVNATGGFNALYLFLEHCSCPDYGHGNGLSSR